jgi:hypothetical protein
MLTRLAEVIIIEILTYLNMSNSIKLSHSCHLIRRICQSSTTDCRARTLYHPIRYQTIKTNSIPQVEHQLDWYGRHFSIGHLTIRFDINRSSMIYKMIRNMTTLTSIKFTDFPQAWDVHPYEGN